MTSALAAIPVADAAALTCFLVCWLGFGPLAEWHATQRPSLITVVRQFRHRWITLLARRDNHIADVTILSNLLRGTLFFASTTIFIIAGLAALLGTAARVTEVVSQLPFAAQSEVWLTEIKIMTLIGVYVYAFFKFTWSAWQYNVLSIMVGMAPEPETEDPARAMFVQTATRLAALGGDSYNNGIRAYYFSMALMAWFLHPLLFIAATLMLTVVLYLREFSSPTLSALVIMEGQSPMPRQPKPPIAL